MSNEYRTLVINPKKRTTAIAVFRNYSCIFERTIQHNELKIKDYDNIMKHAEYRKNLILKHLEYDGINISKLSAICARGGLLKPISGGTYEVNEAMISDLQSGQNGLHPSNLGGIIAKLIADDLNIKAYIVDPVVVDELNNIARYSGIPEIPRKSIFHALNHKAVARRAAQELNKHYEEINLIVTHMAGGITVGAHQSGKVIDVNNGLDGDGPFSVVRAGSLPAGSLTYLCFSGNYKYDEMIHKIIASSGLKAYIGTDQIDEIEVRIKNGDRIAKEAFSAMAYQIAKEIGAMSAVLSGNVDGIVLTGELAQSSLLTQMISDRVNWIADIFIYPGADELQALNEGTLRVLHGEEKVKNYTMNGNTKEYLSYEKGL